MTTTDPSRVVLRQLAATLAYRAANHLDGAGVLDLYVAREQGQRQLLCGGNDQRIERVAVESQLVGGDDLLARQVERLIGGIAEQVVKESASDPYQIFTRSAGAR